MIEYNGKCYADIEYNGKVYQNFSQLAKVLSKEYNIPRETIYARLKKGYSYEEVLKSEKNIDHLGNLFSSTEEMCKHWDISTNTYRSRIDKGWTVEDALKKPTSHTCTKPRQVYDHLGNKYSSLSQLVAKYGVSSTFFNNAIATHKTLEQALKLIPMFNRNTRNASIGNLRVNKLAYKSNEPMNYFYCIKDFKEVILSEKDLVEYWRECLKIA